MSFGVARFPATQQKLQKTVIRVLSCSDFAAPTRPLFRRHGILKLPEFNNYHNACTVYRAINKFIPNS